MTDDFEPRLRESLRAIALPTAPPAIHDYFDDLRARGEPVVPRRPYRRVAVLVAAAAALLVLAIGTLLMSGSPSPAPPPSPSALPGPTATTANGPRTFVAPGITFDYPVGWTDQSTAIEYPAFGGVRFVALIARGMTVCAVRYGATAAPTPQPSTCEVEADRPGTALVSILEYTHPYPWMPIPGTEMTIAGYSAWKQNATWIIRSPDDGLYIVTVNAPSTDLAADGAPSKRCSRACDSRRGRRRRSPWTVGSTRMPGAVSRSIIQRVGAAGIHGTAR